MAGGKEKGIQKEERLMIFRNSLYLICLISSCISAANDICGNWINIGFTEEGVYNNEPYSGTMYLDTIEYMMIVDSDTCKAFAFSQGRIYNMNHSFAVSNDSILAQALEIPISWKRNGDTLFTSMYYVDNDYWEKVTFIFISKPSSRFPNNWPVTNAVYIPDQLTPFGPFSFGSSPVNPVNAKQVKRMIKIKSNKPFSYFQLNGRICKKPTNHLTQILIVNDIILRANHVKVFIK